MCIRDRVITEVATVRGEFQKLEVALNVMLGSADKADNLMAQLIHTAATTPFEMCIRDRGGTPTQQPTTYSKFSEVPGAELEKMRSDNPDEYKRLFKAE